MRRLLPRLSIVALLGALLVLVGPAACNVVAGLDRLEFAPEDAGPFCMSAVACDDENPCTTDTCSQEGLCAHAAQEDGPSPVQIAGDCRVTTCTGGQPVDGDDDDDKPTFAGDCQEGQCLAGKPSAKLYPASTPCSLDGGKVCDGDGACVACTADAQCGPSDECQSNTCVGHACAQTFTAAQTKVAAQVPGDCHADVCDGAGKVINVADDMDPMGDGNPCSDDVCTDGVLTHPSSPVDTVCGAGLVCDGSGACVGCVADAQCIAPATCGGCGMPNVCCCQPKTCTDLGLHCGSAPDGCGGTLTCDDGKNDGETDVDCGGPSCAVKCGAGQVCASNADCAGGACADGVCCDSACDGPCQSCKLANQAGTCSPIVAGVDPSPPGSCSGGSACDAAGNCKKINGQPCPGGGGDCVSGNCADGVCCGSVCAGQCKTCNNPANPGSCGNIPAGQPDNAANLVCNGASVCDGGGLCKKASGQACAVNSDCITLFCADGVCCNSTCSTTCQACNVAGSVGTCTNLPAGQPDPNATISCTGGSACNGGIGFNACKKATGQPCAFNNDCVTALCTDGVCCAGPCSTACHSCNLAGSVGTCSVITSAPDNSPVNICAGPMSCDAAGSCKKVDGQLCLVGSDCVSGACADGVCCNVACSGGCQSCTAALKGGGLDGTCGPTQAGIDPDGDCVSPLTCNGAGSCQ
jgi:hypothetical protein